VFGNTDGPGRAGSTKWRRDTRLEKRCRVFESDSFPATQFRRMYDRGDLPLAIQHGAVKTLIWKVSDVATLDYSTLLPTFIEGLREKTEPYAFVASVGTRHLIQAGHRVGGHEKLLPIISQAVIPLKLALITRDPTTVVKALECLQQLVQPECTPAFGGPPPSQLIHTGIGMALVPYFRQLLPVLNIYKGKKMNLGDGIDYSQQKRDFRNIGELIEETLNMLEVSGGPDAYINIKYLVPTYESCVDTRRTRVPAMASSVGF